MNDNEKSIKSLDIARKVFLVIMIIALVVSLAMAKSTHDEFRMYSFHNYTFIGWYLERYWPGLLPIPVFVILQIKYSGAKTDMNNTPAVARQNTSTADELKKYKELLDTGAITQEEFDKKKAQILKL